MRYAARVMLPATLLMLATLLRMLPLIAIFIDAYFCYHSTPSAFIYAAC